MTLRRRLLLLLLTPGSLAAQGLRLDAGVGVSSGTYLFQERTTTWSASAGLAVELGAVTLRGSIPVLLQNSTLVAGTGMGHLPTGGSSSRTVADTGQARRHGSHLAAELSHGRVEVPSSAAEDYRTALGDPVFALGWRSRGLGPTGFSLGASVKAPLADTATYGTGEWDVGASAGLTHRLTERLLLGVDLAYWRLGDMPDLELRDPVYGTASLGWLGTGGWGASLLASGGSTVLEGYDPPFSIGAGLHRLGDGSAWSVLGTVGLTETAPDVTLGALWSVRLTR